MDNMSSWSSCAFELEDIEIIDHKTENEEKLGKWHCNQCSLFFLDKRKLEDHKKKHSLQECVKCKYCQKKISSSSVNRECYVNKKCETCEYKCSTCPQRFLRHSSLINHEKKHKLAKNKKSVKSTKRVNGNTEENVATVSKGRKRKLEPSDIEERNMHNESVSVKNNSKKKLINRKKVTLDDENTIEVQKRLSLKAVKSTEKNSLVKSPKRFTIKNSKCLEEKVSDKSNKNTIAVNSQTVTANPNLSTSENVVNYKPFSCHVCGNTFASDNVLLDHIRTHGENAAKNFKCKFCGDIFGDIYKMQYHLAICPLAEDELESSLKQVIPKNVVIKNSSNTSGPRKRGRPKKTVDPLLDGDNSKNELTPPSPKRRYVRRRRSEVLESNEAVDHSPDSSSQKQIKKFQNKDYKLSNEIDENTLLAKNNTNLTMPDSVADVSKECEQDDGKKKIHQCPFPHCDFKFTREKALLCHMRNHSDDFDDSLKCHKCDIPFDDIHALRQHIDTCKGIKEEKDDDFHRKDACDVSPNRTFHKSKKEFVCNYCGRSHQNQEKLNSSHQCIGFEREYIGKKTLRTHKCNVCQAEFESELEENDHMVIHTRMVTESLCLRCYNYFNQASLKQHKCGVPIIKSLRSLIEFSVDQENITPKVVTQMFSTSVDKNPAKLRNCYMNKNVNQLYLCQICKLSFVSKKLCKEHQNSHGKKNRITCACCNKKFFSKKSLRRHVRNLKLSINCSFCKKKISNRIDLTKHLNEYHLKEINTFECELCKVTFSDASAAIDHFMLHTLKSSVNIENSSKSGVLIDSPHDQDIDKWNNLVTNRKPQTRKLSCRPSSCRGKVIAAKNKYMIGLRRTKLGGKYVSGQKKQTRFRKLKNNSIMANNGIEYRDNHKGLKNKENIPVNSIRDDTMENSLLDFTSLHKDLIKPCYISLENISSHMFTEAVNTVTNIEEESKADEKNDQNKFSPVLSHIKSEKNDDQIAPGAKDIVLKYVNTDNSENPFDDSKVKCESSESKTCNTEDLDDGVVIVEHLTVYKCSICLEVFETMEFLKCHAIVHI